MLRTTPPHAFWYGRRANGRRARLRLDSRCLSASALLTTSDQYWRTAAAICPQTAFAINAVSRTMRSSRDCFCTPQW